MSFCTNSIRPAPATIRLTALLRYDKRVRRLAKIVRSIERADCIVEFDMCLFIGGHLR